MELLWEDEFSGRRECPGAVRRHIREVLAERLASSELDDVLLVVSELVTNSVLHVGRSLRVRVLIEPGLLRLEVLDDSPRQPIVRRTAQGTEVSGRGLPLVDRLSRAWGIELRERGKCVWSELALTVGEPTQPVSAGVRLRRLPDDRPW